MYDSRFCSEFRLIDGGIYVVAFLFRVDLCSFATVFLVAMACSVHCGVLASEYGLPISGNKFTIVGDRVFDYLFSLDFFFLEHAGELHVRRKLFTRFCWSSGISLGISCELSAQR